MDEIIFIAVAVLLIGSLLIWVCKTAPFIQPPFRDWGVWGTIAVCGAILIIKVVLPLLHMLLGSF